MTSNFIENSIDFIGTGNIVAIALTIISLGFGFFWFFKSFYRLVYSTGTICLTCNKLGDRLNKSNNRLRTRYLFYNNGRKTITNSEILKLQITCPEGQITNVIKSDKEQIQAQYTNEKVDISIEYLDKSKYFIVEVEHFGSLKLDARISETGEILHVESKVWKLVNLFCLVLVVLLFGYYVFDFSSGEMNLIHYLISLFVLTALQFTLRFIHSLFYIPDSITNQHLRPTDKIANKFQSEYF